MRESISVIIPTYNRARYLPEAVGSVLAQTRPPCEIIIVDDGSTDNTGELAKGFPKVVRYIRQQNSGPAAARNRGLREANGDWIAFLDSDDLWVSEKLEVQSRFLHENPTVDFVFAHMVNFSEAGEDRDPEILDRGVYEYCRTNAANLRDFLACLLKVNPVPTSTVLFRRAKAEEIGPLREDIGYADDYQWWLRWAQSAQCGFIDQVLEKRRIHGSNIIGDRRSMMRSVVAVLEDLEVRRDQLERRNQVLLRSALSRERYRLGSEHYRLHDYISSKNVLSKVESSQLEPRERFKWAIKMGHSALRSKFNR